MRLIHLLAAFTLSACAVAPLQQDARGNRLDGLALSLVEELGGPLEDPQVQAYVADLGEQIASSIGDDPRRYSFTVTDSHISNAFALPTGEVIVTQRLVASSRDRAELGAVIAHEIAHIRTGHSAQLEVLRDDLVEDTRNLARGLEGFELAAVNDGISRRLAAFNREQEQEADNLALSYMRAAGLDTQAHVDRLASYLEAEQLDVEAGLLPPRALRPTAYDRHPPTAARLREAQARVARLGPGGARQAALHQAVTNGMIWDQADDAIVQRGSTLFDRDGGLRLPVPRGFAAFVEGDRVLLMAEDVLIVMERIGPIDRRAPVSYQARDFGALTGETRTIERPLSPQGRRASARLIFAQSTTHRYRFAAVTAAGPLARVRLATVDALLRGASRFDPEGPGAPMPRRLTVLPVRAGQTPADFARLMAVDDAAEARFRLLNGLAPSENLRPGATVRIITE